MKTFLFCSAVLIFGAAFSQQGLAQSQRACGDRAQIIERLSTKFGETRRGGGLATSGGIVEVFVSSDTGSWTVLMTMPSGLSCLMAVGESWNDSPADIKSKVSI